MGKIKNAYKTQTERLKGRKNKQDGSRRRWEDNFKIIFFKNRLIMHELNYSACDGLFQNSNKF